MDVKCIGNSGCKYVLTVGKIYKVIESDLECYRIVDDRKAKIKFYKWRFEIVNRDKIYELWT
jgi:hypothetical protein